MGLGFTMEFKFIIVLIIFEYDDIIILGLRVCQCWQHSIQKKVA